MIALGTQRLPGTPGGAARRPQRRADLRATLSRSAAARFRALHPGIRLSIDTSHRQALFPMEGVDLSIRMGKGAWPGVKSDLLFREQLVPVASPSYIASVARNGAIDWPKVTFLRVSIGRIRLERVDRRHRRPDRNRATTCNSTRPCIASKPRRADRHCRRPDAAGVAGPAGRPAGQGRREDRRYRDRILACRSERPGNPSGHSIVPKLGARRSEAILRGKWFALCRVRARRTRAHKSISFPRRNYSFERAPADDITLASHAQARRP